MDWDKIVMNNVKSEIARITDVRVTQFFLLLPFLLN